MKRSRFLISVGAALLLSPVVLSAGPQDTPPNRPNPRRPAAGQFRRGQGARPMEQGPAPAPRRSLSAELGLTEVQQGEIRKAMESARRDRLRKSTDLRIANLDLRSLLRAEKVDEKAVAAKLSEAAAAQAALLELRVDSLLAMKRILTPEQQKTFAQMRAERRPQRMGRGVRMRGMSGGRGNRMRRMIPSEAGQAPGMRPGIRRNSMNRGSMPDFMGPDSLELDEDSPAFEAGDREGSIPAVLY